MNIALIGASGNVGSRLLDEALRRKHQITAIARNPEKIPRHPGVIAASGDASDPASLIPLLRDRDVVISAIRFDGNDPAKTIAAVKEAGVKRLVVVGGAGSLEPTPGVRLYDTPTFPDAYKPEAKAGGRWLDALKRETVLDWTMLSPSAMFGPGQHTGKFRLGTDALLVAADGKSHISFEDYAVALLDEVEKPQHSRARFTVGY